MLRLLLALGVAAGLVAGTWIAGGVLTNDFVASVILTGVWLAGTGLACLALSWRHRRLRLPLLLPYAIVALAAMFWLGRAEFFDKTADEDVVKAEPAAPTKRSAAPRNVLVSRGSFESLEHESTGVASVIRTRRGKHVLTLTRFGTSNGPDLRVYVAAGPVADAGDVHDFADLGALKGNKGDQQYELTGKALNGRYRTVVIWCRAFSVGFARARLSRE